MTREKLEYLTPAEIIEKFPELEDNFNWDAKSVGLFLRTKLLKGRYNSNERKALIQIDSVVKLVEFTNIQIESQKVNVK